MAELDELKQERFQIEIKLGRVDTQIMACQDKSQRRVLINESKALNKDLDTVANKIARIERAETLKAQQAERDRAANRQNNNTGRSKNRQRDIL